MIPLHMDVEDSRFGHALAEHLEFLLEMDGESYRLWRLGEAGSGYRLSIRRRAGEKIWGRCACPDWQYRASKEGLPCKHLWIAAESLGFVRFPAAGSSGAGAASVPPSSSSA